MLLVGLCSRHKAQRTAKNTHAHTMERDVKSAPSFTHFQIENEQKKTKTKAIHAYEYVCKGITTTT